MLDVPVSARAWTQNAGIEVDPAFTVRVMLALPATLSAVASSTFDGSALVIVTTTPPGGAARPSEPLNCTWRFLPMVAAPMLIGGVGSTRTLAVACAMPVPLARIVVLPTATPVTGTAADVRPAPTKTVNGAVATAVLSIDVFNVSPPAGAGDDRLSVIFAVRPRMPAKFVAGVKLKVSVTLWPLVSGARPAALAVMDAVPGVTPVICGFAAGIRSRSGMNTRGVIVATLVSLLSNEIVTPPGGASMPRLTANPEL